MARKRDMIWDDRLLQAPHEAEDKSPRVRAMFNAIAPTYERVNTLCSAGRDATWRREAVRLARVEPKDRVLDVACGTGDLARAFARAGPRDVVGCDFARAMLALAARRSSVNTHWCEGDAHALPFADGAFSIVSCAFGVRNFQDLDRGLREFHRVLQPGGRAVILEFTHPRRPLPRFLYEFYCDKIMATVATWISGDRTGAYRYLPRSIKSFQTAEQMKKRLASAGFDRVAVKSLTFGVVAVYMAYRDSC